ncbi:hypothetical protein ASPCAL14315 [Aspergillus calidoustus]|uniref:F-box domain-containing protein n=1 Tax=Aspergillus calidoustus TaxID=454130 RepID=A0A0U5CJI4_ASPCI|nr:hypothetical protein ASPCAL14315 [Aspergillus calidoustus]
MSLSTLPTELLLHIATYADNEKDLNNLVRSCRRLYTTLNDTLYKRHAEESATSALIWAAERGMHKTAKRFLALGADVNATNEDRLTVLMLAAAKGHEEVVRTILGVEGIDVNAQHWLHKRTALHYAAMEGHYEVVRVLIGAKGIGFNIPEGNYGGTPLIALISATAPGKEEVMRLIVEQEDIDLNQADTKWELSPLLWAIQDEQTEIACILLEKKTVDVNFADPRGRTPLWWAAKLGDETCLRLLLARDHININTPNHKGQTPLWVAAKHGHEGVVQMLLREGADPTTRDNKHYRDALMVAAVKERTDVVCLLLREKNINFTGQDSEVVRAFVLQARERGHWETVKVISETLGMDGMENQCKEKPRTVEERLHV